MLVNVFNVLYYVMSLPGCGTRLDEWTSTGLPCNPDTYNSFGGNAMSDLCDPLWPNLDFMLNNTVNKIKLRDCIILAVL